MRSSGHADEPPASPEASAHLPGGGAPGNGKSGPVSGGWAQLVRNRNGISFLDGFFLNQALEFEEWIDRERGRLASSYAKALEALAEAADAHRDFTTAATWWKTRAAHDPYDSRVARRLIQALDAGGNRGAALQHAGIHERLLQEEFGVAPDPETRAVVLAIRARAESPAPVADQAWQPPSPAPASHPVGAETAATAAAAPAGLLNGSPPARRVLPRVAGWGGAVAGAMVAIWLLTTFESSSGPRAEAGFGESTATARGAGDDLDSAARPAALARSIAVLPFLNLSADADEEYFSDGLSEALIAALAGIGALRVAARTSSFVFKGKPGDIRQIGEALNVGSSPRRMSSRRRRCRCRRQAGTADGARRVELGRRWYIDGQPWCNHYWDPEGGECGPVITEELDLAFVSAAGTYIQDNGGGVTVRGGNVTGCNAFSIRHVNDGSDAHPKLII
jgi:hypothetical protein